MKDKHAAFIHHKSFSVSVSLFVVGIVLVLLSMLFVSNRIYLRNLYHEEYSHRVLDINEFIALQVDGDKVEEYAATLQKDDDYAVLEDTLHKMQATFDVRYLYVIVERGDPNSYTYIFDTQYDPQTNTYAASTFGSLEEKSVFPGADEVLRSGTSFEEARLYTEPDFGNLYYAYEPIRNSGGRVVGLLGTDIDATPMLERLRENDQNMLIFGLVAFVVIFFIVLLYCKKKFSDPLIKLTSDIIGLSHGDLDVDVSKKLYARKDEFGLIYRAFDEVAKTIRSLVHDMNATSQEVLHGLLQARMGERPLYQGSYAQVMENANRMLESNRRVLDMMPSFVRFYDRHHTLLYQNSPAQGGLDMRLSGQGEISDHFDALDLNHTAIRESFDTFVKSNERSGVDYFAFPSGEGKECDFRAFFIRADTGDEDIVVCAVFTDITEYAEMCLRAEASSKAKSEFLSRMSHEIRTPLNAILGMTHLAKRDSHDARVLQRLGTIESSATHLLTIINDVLDISKIEAGSMVLSEEAFSLRAMLREVMLILEPQAALGSVRLRLTIAGFEEAEPIAVLADEVRLRQVMMNLVTNAVKFSRPGGEVILRLERLGGTDAGTLRANFSVRDFGIGIDEEHQQQVFEAFEQGGSNISRQYGGTGLGLPISNRIVRLMGSEGIALESAPDEGSTFRFDLSLKKADLPAASRTHAEASQEVNLQGLRILVVDDIELNREIVEALLEGSGAEIHMADDGTTALEAYLASPEGYFSLILMDIQMRELDGYAATRRIRAAARGDSAALHIVAMSANAFQADMEKAQESGMDGYITKPVNYDDMMKELARVLAL